MEQKNTKTQTKSEKVEEKAPEIVEKDVESVKKVEMSIEEMEEIVEKAKKYDELVALKRIDKDKVTELVSNLRKECYSNFTISRTQMLTLIDNLLARLRNF